MERQTIEIEQEIERHERGQFSVLMTVTDSEVILSKEFMYYKTNQAYPIYKSLISILREYSNVNVILMTKNIYVLQEINNIHGATGTLAKMLAELLTENNLTIKAI